MKHTLLISALTLLSITAFGLSGKELEIPIPYDTTSSKYAYVEVVELDTSASYIYENSKSWLVKKYLSNEFNLDEPSKTLVQGGSFDIVSTLKAGMGMKFPYNYAVNFDIILDFKDGKYRYTLTNIKMSQNAEGTTTEQSLENFIHSSDEMGMGRKKMEKYIVQTCEIINEEFQKLILEMKNGITSQQIKSDW